MFRNASVLLRGSATQGTQLTVNGLTAAGFAAGASLVIISNFHNVLALERGVYITLTNGAGGMGALCAKGTLTRVQWEFPIAPGAFAGLFDSRRMVFVYGTQGTNADVAVYTAKAPPTHTGTVTVPHFNRVLFDNADLLTVGTVTGVTTVACYQKKLNKKWECDAPGSFFGAYGGGVFVTRVTTPSNDVYRVYASGTEIANYTYTRK